MLLAQLLPTIARQSSVRRPPTTPVSIPCANLWQTYNAQALDAVYGRRCEKWSLSITGGAFGSIDAATTILRKTKKALFGGPEFPAKGENPGDRLSFQTYWSMIGEGHRRGKQVGRG